MPGRLITIAFWRLHVGLAAAMFVAIVFASVAIVFRIADNSTRANELALVNAHQCVLILQLNGAILESLERSRKSLPSIGYYRRHPVEERRAMRDLNHSIRRFKSIRCPT